MSFASLPIPPSLEDALSNIVFKWLYFLIYIPEYCRLLLYKHYQKVVLFGVICGSILIKAYLIFLSPVMPSFLLGKIIFGIYLGFVLKIVCSSMFEFSEWMKSYKANKLLRSGPEDLPMSKKNVYTVLDELAKSVAAHNMMTRQGFWWKSGENVESDKDEIVITEEFSLNERLAAKLAAAESRGEVIDVEDDEMKMAMRVRKEMRRRFKARCAADASESAVKQEKSD